MSVQNHMESEDVLGQILRQVNELAVMPQVAYKVIETVGQDSVSVQEIEDTISIDPGFSTKVLRAANSASLALAKPVTNIKEAVSYLGTRQIRDLAMAVGIFDFFLGKTDRESLRRRSWWRQSLDTASCARHLGRRFVGRIKVNSEEAYTFGLMHLLGRTILDRFDPVRYDQVLEKVNGGMHHYAAEREVFGTDHVEVITCLTKNWKLPDELTEALSYIEPPGPQCATPANAAIIAVSHHTAKVMLEGVKSANELISKFPAWALELLDIDEMKLQIFVLEGEQAITRSRLNT